MKAGLQAFQKEQGLPQDVMPFATDLKAAGRLELYKAVDRAGVWLVTQLHCCMQMLLL